MTSDNHPVEKKYPSKEFLQRYLFYENYLYRKIMLTDTDADLLIFGQAMMRRSLDIFMLLMGEEDTIDIIRRNMKRYGKDII